MTTDIRLSEFSTKSLIREITLRSDNIVMYIASSISKDEAEMMHAVDDDDLEGSIAVIEEEDLEDGEVPLGYISHIIKGDPFVLVGMATDLQIKTQNKLRRLT